MNKGNGRKAWLLILAAGLIIAIIFTRVLSSSQTRYSNIKTPTLGPNPIAEARQTLVEGVAGSPLHINPLLAPLNPADADLAVLIFNGLTRPGEHGEAQPDLAERWEVTGDGKVYTFYLRKNITWHDGRPFTADDVVATIRALQDPAFPGDPALAAFWRKITVDKADEATVRFILPEPYAPFPEATGIGLLPAHRLSGLSGKALAEDALNQTPIGTGPYLLAEAREGQIVLNANPGYYRGAPKIGRIVFRFYRDQQSVIGALKRGEIMAAGRLSPDEAAQLAETPGITLYSGPLTAYTLIFLNLKLPYFEDRLVRQALLYALDRQRIVERFLDGRGRVLHSPILPESWAYYGEIKRYDYDPEKARALLEKAGWKMGTDGIREKDGVKLQFSLLTNDDPQRIALIEEISRQWAALGIKAETQTVGIDGLINDYLKPRRFDAILYGWARLPGDPDPYELWHSSQASAEGTNFAGFTHRKVDELLEDARRTTDRAVRLAAYQQFQALFAEHVPALLLFQPMYVYALSKDIQGFRATLLIDQRDRLQNIAEWSIIKNR